MKKMKNLIARLVLDHHGQDIIEYALLAVFIMLVATVGATALGLSLNNLFGTVATDVNKAVGSAS